MQKHIADPFKAAEYFAEIEHSNYLAHSIRKIEDEFINEGGVPYRIFTKVSANISNAVTLFFKDFCIINLPKSEDEKMIRLELGHELGHLIFRFDDLKNSRGSNNMETSHCEEVFAWVFAYNLIRIKSDMHEDNKQMKKFVYETGRLKTDFLDTIKKKNPKILDDVILVLDSVSK